MPIPYKTLRALGAVLASCSIAMAQGGAPEYRVGLEGKPWSVVMKLADFEIRQNMVRPDGRRYFYGGNAKTGVNVSVTLEKTGKPASHEGCKQHLQRVVEGNGGLARDVEYSESDRFAFAAYTIAEVQGMKIKQRFFRACTVRDDVYIDFNLSKVLF